MRQLLADNLQILQNNKHQDDFPCCHDGGQTKHRIGAAFTCTTTWLHRRPKQMKVKTIGSQSDCSAVQEAAIGGRSYQEEPTSSFFLAISATRSKNPWPTRCFAPAGFLCSLLHNHTSQETSISYMALQCRAYWQCSVLHYHASKEHALGMEELKTLSCRLARLLWLPGNSSIAIGQYPGLDGGRSSTFMRPRPSSSHFNWSS